MNKIQLRKRMVERHRELAKTGESGYTIILPDTMGVLDGSFTPANEPIDPSPLPDTPVDKTPLPEKHFNVQEFILERTPWQDRAALLAQAEIDALRLRSEDNG